MHLRSLIFLLALAGVSASCIDSTKLEAQRFFSQIASKYAENNHVEVFDLMYGKLSYFLSPFLSDYNATSMRAAFVTRREKILKERIPSCNVTQRNMPELSMTAEMAEEFMARAKKLDNEGREFLGKTLNSLSGRILHYSDYKSRFDRFLANFDELGATTKRTLTEECELFGKLDEIQPLFAAFEEIVEPLLKVCANLPEFDRCKMVLHDFQ